jgi:hypothetical protein
VARRASTPDSRASDGKKRVESVRRKYKTNTKSRAKLLDVEIPHVKTMVGILKVAGYNRTQIAKVIGISRGQVTEFLETKEVEKLIVDLREGLPLAALDLMHGYMIEAVQAIVDVMRTSDDGGVVLKAAAEVLDRGGMPKQSRQERVNENTNTEVLEFGGEFVEMLRQASPEIQEQAAKMIEDLETLLKQEATKGA